MTWACEVLTLFPELFPGPLGVSVIGRAIDKGICSIKTINIRDYAHDRHTTVDDMAYGGGGGMVARPDVLGEAIDKGITNKSNPLIYMSPRGAVLNQDLVRHLTFKHQGLNIICGRFSGIDERILKHYDIVEISIGDYVLTNGELAAFALLDACIRLLPGVLGDDASAIVEESFGTDYRYLLEYPQYTRPVSWRGMTVPSELLSGNHKRIAAWRREQAESLTKERRLDLWLRHYGDKPKAEW